MKRKLVLFYSTLVGLICFNLTSCVDIDLTNVSKDVQINESLVVPVGAATLSVGDLVKMLNLQGQVAPDADTLNFIKEFDEDYLFADFNLLANASEKDLSLPFPTAVVEANTSLSIPGGNQFQIEMGLDPNSTSNRADSAAISLMNVGVNVLAADIARADNTPVTPSDLKFTLVFPKMHYTGNYSQISKDFTPYQFGQFSPLELTNFVVNTVGMTGLPFEVLFKTGSNSLRFGANARIDLKFKINNMTYTVIYGKFNPQVLGSTSKTIPLDVLNDIPLGIRFANPKLSIRLHSNFGSYMIFNILSIKAFNKDQSIVKTAMFGGSQTAVEVVDVKPDIPGSFVDKTLRTLDKNYGSTDILLDPDLHLDTLQYKFSLLTDDALNSTSNTPGFIIPGMKITTKYLIEIPFYLKAGSYYSISDTIPNLTLPLDVINEATLVLNITNSLPLKLTYQMKFMDASNTLINTAFNDITYTIKSADVNPTTGLVKNEINTPLNITLSKTDAASLKNAKKMIFSLSFAGGTNNVPIQVTSNNFIKVKLGAFVKGKLSNTLGSKN
jgi:hypothetical protein